MPRIASAFCLAGWIGFNGIAGLRVALGDGPAASGGAAPQVVLAGLFVAMAGTLLAALAGLQSGDEARIARAEPLAGAVLVAVFTLQAAALANGAALAALFGTPALFAIALALSFAALLFDHWIANTGDAKDDRAFHDIEETLEAARRSAVDDSPNAGADRTGSER